MTLKLRSRLFHCMGGGGVRVGCMGVAWFGVVDQEVVVVGLAVNRILFFPVVFQWHGI